MVNGLASFKEWFRGCEEYYVIIGGTACDLLMSEAGSDFRVTKDIDMVLIVEVLDISFCERLWEFIRAAGYDFRQKSTGRPHFYRFSCPESPEYPYMIELFSRHLDEIKLSEDAVLTPLPVEDEISSLSAILLDDQYYFFLKDGVKSVSGISILDAEHLIPLKAKAWLDLSNRKADGDLVDSRSIRKHKNDILRLAALLSAETTIELPETLKNDMNDFLNTVGEGERFIRVAGAYGFSPE
ncbi:MAG: hypothetical protein FWD43_04585 [Coriobacteriia bacterium]|nr:hypothetical protein [Coriobacteriia bacterium]